MKKAPAVARTSEPSARTTATSELTVSEKLVQNSIAAALASIENYNKPDFRYREEVFTILIVNAWELLLKARILRASGEDPSSLHAKGKDGKPKLTRSANQ